MYYYKARIYSPTLGRFLQTDPVGYDDQFNLYAYVANDPVNATDPTGMEKICTQTAEGGEICTEVPEEEEIVVTGTGESSTVATVAGTAASILVPGYDLANCAIYGGCGTADLVFAAIDVIPAGKLISKGRKGYKAFRALRRACGCVVAGTLVATPTGLVAIETLEVGDEVLAYDVATGEMVPQPVLDLLKTEPKPTYDVVLRAANGETARFEATDDHPWLNAAKEWRKTEELAVGEWLIAGDGDRFEVVEAGLTGDVEAAYTLTVGELHTYIMGEAGLVVHNACTPSKARKTLQQVRRTGRGPGKGGRVFQNREGRLPQGGRYREYDVDPQVPGQSRNAERIVIDENTGQAWYTSDHYQSFTQM